MNTHRNNLLRAMQLCSVLLLTAFIVASAQAQTSATAATKDSRNDASRGVASGGEFRLLDLLAQARPARRAGFSLMPSSGYTNTNVNSLHITAATAEASPPAVHGTGTVGNISMFVGTNPAGNSILGDSIITQLNGNIGIGIATPTSKLTVQGMIETTLGGYKFPDGTVQTTAAVSGLTSIFHDATLQGDGTGGSSLGVAVPLNLSGAVPGTFAAVIKATNLGELGSGVIARGGNSSSSAGGLGVFAIGGNTSSNDGGFPGGDGLRAGGGDASIGGGGSGVSATGGKGGSGGYGVFGIGGDANGSGSGGIGVQGDGGIGHIGGVGVLALGGFSTSISGGASGAGVLTFGAPANGTGNIGGRGINAFAGPGFNGATDGPAGVFHGDVQVSGNLSKGGGSFKIDHPLDPENKYLYHSFVESPDMKNIYDGTVTTDANGDASVSLPDYFEALNRDFRYQLTVMGTFAQAIVADEIKDNRFTIKTNAANVKVSWQVTGIRQDAYANKNRIKVEEDKTERERGFYLHPDAFSQPEERGVEWARNPEMMRQMKETLEKALKAKRD